MRTESVDVTVGYRGSGLEANAIDVKVLAPSLLALSEAVSIAHKVVNPGQPAPRVVITATRRGSFVVSLGVEVSFLESLLDALNSRDTTALVNATALVGVLVGSIKALIGIYRKKRKPTSIDKHQDVAVMRFGDGTSVTVPVNVFDVLKNGAYVKALSAFSAPLYGHDIQAIDIDCEDDQVCINSEDKEAFALPLDVKDINQITEVETLVDIIQSSFDPSYKWRVSEDGQNPISATMADEDFQKRIDSGKVSFKSGDRLRVILRSSRKLKPNNKLAVDHQIVKVINHIKAPIQPELPLNDL